MDNSEIYFPIYVKEYMGSTMELDAIGHGIYLLLMFYCWDGEDGQLLPNKMEALKRISRSQDEELIMHVIQKYFTETEGGYFQKRLVKTKEKVLKKITASRENGKLGGRPIGSKKPKNNPQVSEDVKPKKNLQVIERKPKKNPAETYQKPTGEPNHKPNNNPEETILINSYNNKDINLNKNINSKNSADNEVASFEIPDENSFTSPSQPEKNKRFSKPTVEQISEFVKTENLQIRDVQYLYDYYESKGWMVGRSPMKDWKSAVRNWARRGNNFSIPPEYSGSGQKEFSKGWDD